MVKGCIYRSGPTDSHSEGASMPLATASHIRYAYQRVLARGLLATPRTITSMLLNFPDTQHDQRKNTDRERRHDQHGLSRGHLNAKQVNP